MLPEGRYHEIIEVGEGQSVGVEWDIGEPKYAVLPGVTA
ncbi:unnamed protein product, partial [marine sediment metagenome]